MTDKHIQWYPGHMHKAGKEIAAAFSRVDVFIELLDARIPFSSSNPLLKSLRGDKPNLKVFTKCDLSDFELTKIWQNYYEADPRVRVVPVDLRKSQSLSQIPVHCRQIYAENGGNRPNLTAMVMGVPNVGKSTLINGLAGRAVANTGDVPAVTKNQQTVEIEPNFLLLDTPGMLWPKIENRHSGYRLAITGAIRDTAISHFDIALYALGYLASAAGDRLADRYKLDDQSEARLMLAEIGRRRGCLVKGGKVNLDRAAKVLISDIRVGRLGRITWETPDMITAELQQVEIDRAEKAQNKAERKRNWRISAKV